MPLAFNRSLNRQNGQPEAPYDQDQEAGLNVSVIFTSVGATISALKRAGSLAQSLGARITLLVPQIMPYPLPLTTAAAKDSGQPARQRSCASCAAPAMK